MTTRLDRTGYIPRGSSRQAGVCVAATLLAIPASGAVPAASGTPSRQLPGRVVVTLEQANAATVIDIENGNPVARIEDLPAPHEVVSTRSGRRAFVAETGASAVAEIDLATGRVSRRFELPGELSPHDVALSSDESTLWVASGFGGAVVAIELGTGRVGETIPTGAEGSWMIAALGNGSVATANLEGGSVSLIDPASRQVQVVAPAPRAMAMVQPRAGTVWVGDAANDSLFWIDPAQGRVTRRMTVGGEGVTRLRRIPGRSEIALVTGHRLVLLDPEDAAPVFAVQLPHRAKNVTFSPAGTVAVATHPDDDAISVIDLVQRQVVATYPVEGTPDSVAWATP